MILLCTDLQDRQECFLRNLDTADALHPLLPFLLLFKKLALAGDVSAVTLGKNVLSKRLDGFPRDHAVADRRLNGNLEHLPWDKLTHLRRQRSAAFIRRVLVDD